MLSEQSTQGTCLHVPAAEEMDREVNIYPPSLFFHHVLFQKDPHMINLQTNNQQ